MKLTLAGITVGVGTAFTDWDICDGIDTERSTEALIEAYQVALDAVYQGVRVEVAHVLGCPDTLYAISVTFEGECDTWADGYNHAEIQRELAREEMRRAWVNEVEQFLMGVRERWEWIRLLDGFAPTAD